MRCPFCEADDDKVVDSRPADEGAAVRRRRECLVCGRRFTTYERVDELPFMVVKRSGEREPFDAEKVRAGIERAVAGSAIEPAAVDELVAEVEEALGRGATRSRAERIGRAVLERLRVLDPCPTLRFASVYKGFDDLGDFEREVAELQKRPNPSAAVAASQETSAGLRPWSQRVSESVGAIDPTLIEESLAITAV